VSVFRDATTKKIIEVMPVSAMARALRLFNSRFPYLKDR